MAMIGVLRNLRERKLVEQHSEESKGKSKLKRNY